MRRRQFNGIETDAHRGVWTFGNDLPRCDFEFPLGLPTQYIISIGDVHRGFRNWDMQYFVGDTRKVKPICK